MKALNKDAQNLRTIYSENDVDRIENEILSGGEESGSGLGSGSGLNSGSDIYNNCFFNVMAAACGEYELEQTSEQLHHKYFNDGFGDEYERTHGPYSMTKNKDGEYVPNPNAHNFITQYFVTKDEEWQSDTHVIENYCVHNSGNNKGIVIAVVDMGPEYENDHVIILTHAQGNIYTYNDPTSGEKNKEINVRQIRWATKIMGPQTEENEE